MPRIYYDDASDQIVIEGRRQTYAPRSLIAGIDRGDIVVHLVGNTDDIVGAPHTQIFDRAGLGFVSLIEAKTYLDGEFAKRRQNSALMTTMTAAAALGGHRAVRAEVTGLASYASSDLPDEVGRCAGITATAAEQGAEVEIVTAGEMIEPSWAWSIGPVWLGSDGALTQAPPTTGFDQQIGVAIAPTRLIVDIAPALILAAQE